MLELIFGVALVGVLRARVLRYERIHLAESVWWFEKWLREAAVRMGICGDGGSCVGVAFGGVARRCRS